MENLVELIFNAENVRTALILAVIICGFTLQNSRIDKKMLELKLDLKNLIDEKINNFHLILKSNDFEHLNSTIEALTFTLEKNKFLSRDDKDYIDSRLDK